MPLLGTYSYTGVLSLAGRAQGCIAHSLVTQPDWCMYIGTGSFAALGLCYGRQRKLGSFCQLFERHAQ